VLRVPRGGLGHHQLAVLALGALDSPADLSAGDVETATGLQRPNVHKMLQRLTELGHLVQVPDERPAR
jgi:DNA-binding IclR family transcriptional regulator